MITFSSEKKLEYSRVANKIKNTEKDVGNHSKIETSWWFYHLSRETAIFRYFLSNATMAAADVLRDD